MFMGAMPKIVKGVISAARRRHPRGRHHPPQRPLPRRDALPRRRRSSIPIFCEGELVGFSGASAHLLDIGGAYPGLAIDLVGHLVRGQHLPRGQALRAGRPPGARSGSTSSTNTRTPTLQPRRHRGDDRRLRAGQGAATSSCSAATARRRCSARPRDWIDYSERMLRQEIAKVPDGVYETEVGWLDDDGAQPRQAAAGEGEGDRRGRRADDRPHRLERRGADRLQLPLRGHDGLGDDASSRA